MNAGHSELLQGRRSGVAGQSSGVANNPNNPNNFNDPNNFNTVTLIDNVPVRRGIQVAVRGEKNGVSGKSTHSFQ